MNYEITQRSKIEKKSIKNVSMNPNRKQIDEDFFRSNQNGKESN